MNSEQALARRHRAVEELCAATLRALSADSELHFRGRQLHRGRRPVAIHAPHLYPSVGDDDFGSFRGAADAMALRLRLSDAAVHFRLRPADPVARLVFEQLEQFRVESLVPADLPGVATNVRHRNEQWALAMHRDGLTETARGLLLYTVAQVCRARITGEPVLAETIDLMEATRAGLAPLIGDDLAGLRRCRHDQAAFAEYARSLGETVAGLVQAEGDPIRDGEPEANRARPTLRLEFDDDGDGDERPAAASAGYGAGPRGGSGGYRVFTAAHDREHRVATLVRPALLAEHRERLDRAVARQGVNVGRLARALTSLLAEPTREGWQGGQEAGHIDGRTLAQLISSPNERRLFRTERVEPVADVLVTFLIDCSGSMKEHRETVAVLVDVFARALERAGARSEILGYTTGAWNGGRARRDWLRAGRPADPGRLTERCHLVFKDAETPWRRARAAIAGLLKADQFREGVDGEAVTWAAGRAAGLTEGRRLLLVLSDGAPMDSSTSLANDQHYLQHHLADVVADLESAGGEVYGVGVGLDLSPYYRRAQVLDTAAATGYAMFADVLGLLARGPRR